MTINKAMTTFSHQYRIYLEDTDAGGIVYHANHLKFYERCRRDWVRALGMTSYFYQAQSEQQVHNGESSNLQFVVSKATIDYIKPILLDTTITVTLCCIETKVASLILEQQIYDEYNTLLSQAQITLVCVATYQNEQGQNTVRPARLPTAFTQLLN